MIDLTLAIAETVLRAAQAKAKALGAPMTVTVVDEAGRLVLCARGDGTGVQAQPMHVTIVIGDHGVIALHRHAGQAAAREHR